MQEPEPDIGQRPEDDRDFQLLAFQAGFVAPLSGRFWFFPEGEFGFASFGSTGAVGFPDGNVQLTHHILSSVRMHRSGWLNFVKTIGAQMQLSDEEWALVQGQKDGDVTV